MTVVMPMAGRGARMADGGYAAPKPLIDVAGRPMFAWALDSLAGLAAPRLVVVALAEHARHGLLDAVRRHAGPAAEVVLLDGVTEGQLCTVLAARHLLDPDDDLLVMSADTYVASDLAADVAQQDAETHGLISVAALPGDRWSFARTDAEGRVVEVAEKVRISDHASTGLYYFRRTADFLAVADAMIAADERTRGEFYVIPVYQKYVARGWTVRLSHASAVWDMGTPAALAAFEARLRSEGAAWNR